MQSRYLNWCVSAEMCRIGGFRIAKRISPIDAGEMIRGLLEANVKVGGIRPKNENGEVKEAASFPGTFSIGDRGSEPPGLRKGYAEEQLDGGIPDGIQLVEE